tara:strand:- start:890 stop:1267 length:378 start_codon:yes stop_codon:yes gene_type:complete
MFRTQHKSNRQASDTESKINPKVYSQEHQTHIFADWMMKHHHKRGLKLFDELLDAGICREQARGILPQNMYTEYYGTVNLNNLLKFINLRTHEGAQWEIQQVARACKDIASHLFPLTVMAYDNNR